MLNGNKKLKVLVSICIIFGVTTLLLLIADMRNLISNYSDEQTAFSISNINVENWVNYISTILGTVLAVSGTYYYTKKMGDEQLAKQQENYEKKSLKIKKINIEQ